MTGAGMLEMEGAEAVIGSPWVPELTEGDRAWPFCADVVTERVSVAVSGRLDVLLIAAELLLLGSRVPASSSTAVDAASDGLDVWGYLAPSSCPGFGGGGIEMLPFSTSPAEVSIFACVLLRESGARALAALRVW